MCIFSGRVERVSGTHIFARMDGTGQQCLAYRMDLAAPQEVAMVLPLPVAPRAGDDALRFVDLQDRPEMFEDLSKLFIDPREQERGRPALLDVQTVGSFIASYVPTRADFRRLDPRFRAPESMFDAVAEYADYGFAVFQLKAGEAKIHPMAFTFPTRVPERLFFPTVHVHDDAFHYRATFDHVLYYQHARHLIGGSKLGEDEISHLGSDDDYGGIVKPGRHLVRRTLRGQLPNQDTWIDAV